MVMMIIIETNSVDDDYNRETNSDGYDDDVDYDDNDDSNGDDNDDNYTDDQSK